MIDFERLAEVHAAAERAGVSWGLEYQEADGSWYFRVRSQAPVENWDTPKGRSFKTGVDEVLEYLRELII